MKFLRQPQRRGIFVPGRPQEGYYNDLTGEVRSRAATPELGARRLSGLTENRSRANIVSITQLGLGAWQLGREDERWASVARDAAEWLAVEIDADGLLPYHFAMPHTFRLEPPWASAMAQGQAASLFVRVGAEAPRLFDAARRVVEPLFGGEPLVVDTEDGPVLQEYPTSPPSHTLNGWIFALFGLYDVSMSAAQPASAVASRDAFDAGVATLARRLPLYELLGGWSRYDLYPQPLPNVASPFYHRLHVELLLALDRLAPADAFRMVAARWGEAAEATLPTVLAVVRKAAFRAVRPRRLR